MTFISKKSRNGIWFPILLLAIILISLSSNYAFDGVRNLGKMIILVWMTYQLASVSTKKILEVVCPPFDPKDKSVLLFGSLNPFDRSLVKKLADDVGLRVIVTFRPNVDNIKDVREVILKPIAKKECVHFIEVRLEEEESLSSCINNISEILSKTSSNLHGVVVHNCDVVKSMINCDNFSFEFDSAIDIYVSGVMNMMRRVLPLLRKCKGRAIFLTSDSDSQIQAFNTNGAVINASLNSLIESVRREVMYFGVEVMSIRPDCFLSDLFASDDDMAARHLSPPNKETAKCGRDGKNVQQDGKRIEESKIEERRKHLLDTVIRGVCNALTDPYPEYNYLVSSTKSSALNWMTSTVVPDNIGTQLLSICHRVKNLFS